MREKILELIESYRDRIDDIQRSLPGSYQAYDPGDFGQEGKATMLQEIINDLEKTLQIGTTG